MYGFVFGVFALYTSVRLAEASGKPFGPWAFYQTEPTFRTSLFEIHKDENRAATGSGYIFLTNYVSDEKSPSFGPQIYTMDGDLIWNGNHTVKLRAIDLHVCDYQGERGIHLCMNDGIPVEQPGHSSGVIRFLDNSYEQVGEDYGAAGNLRGPDTHELNTPRFGDRNSFLQVIYQRRGVNLTRFKAPEKGFVLDGCFQEIHQTSRAVMFQWCAVDHIDLADTYVYQTGNPDNLTTWIAGDGSKGRPWDWFHINSVDKNEEGDYIVNGRHTNAFYKVAGNKNKLGLLPGTIMWHLGGKNSDFKLDGFNFSRQHHVRFHETTGSTTLISLFNNADDGSTFTAKWSEGQLISLDNQTMTAHIETRYPSPDGFRTYSQGSTQLTGHNTTFIGWGNRPFVSEHDRNGTLLYYAKFTGSVESYRAWKFPWVGKPTTRPKLLGYALDSNSPLYGYVSWNGATEVAAWNLYTSQETARGPWTAVGRVPKKTFETCVNFTALALSLPSPGKRSDASILYRPFMYAEALDASGAVMSTTPVATTFIPNAEARAAYKCNETQCARCANMTEKECDDEGVWFSYGSEHSQAGKVEIMRERVGFEA